ncbi:hypothetical protein AAVH_14054 [Aphelenchoides avenae]|nr:hypothetical protein AAVH_14054 [Aphelenchus avenae]
MLPEIRRETLKFFTRPELEHYQLELNSRFLRDEIAGIMFNVGLLRYVDTDEPAPDTQPVISVMFHLPGGPSANYSRTFDSRSRDDVDDLLRRMSNVFVDHFLMWCVLASNSTGSLEHFMAMRHAEQSSESGNNRPTEFRIGIVHLLLPEADEDFDYAIIDFIGAIVKPNLTGFNERDLFDRQSDDEKGLALLERESFRGRSFTLDARDDTLPPPERLLAPTLLARTCDFRASRFPNHWLDEFIHCFENATFLGTQLEEVTIRWDLSDGEEALPAERLRTPTKTDVPIPRPDLLSADVVRSKSALHCFGNKVAKKRLDVYCWNCVITSSSARLNFRTYTTHFIFFKIIDE